MQYSAKFLLLTVSLGMSSYVIPGEKSTSQPSAELKIQPGAPAAAAKVEVKEAKNNEKSAAILIGPRESGLYRAICMMQYIQIRKPPK